MDTSMPRRRLPPSAGLTVLEMMVVLGIMALVIGLVAPRAIDYFGRAKTQTAEIQMRQLEGALQLLYIDTGRYPTEGEGLSALVTEPGAMTGWRGPYLTDQAGLTDPWGRPYVYQSPGQNGPFDIVTEGRDGQPGGSGEDTDIRL